MSDELAIPSAMTTREVVDAAYRAFGVRDVDALLELLSPDVEWGQPDNPWTPSAGTRRGISGVVEWLQIGNRTEEILKLEPRRFLVDGDTAAVLGHTTIVAKPTGKIYAMDFVHVVSVADGKVVRFQEFFDTWIAAEAFRG